MKKIIIMLTLVALCLALMPFAVTDTSAKGEESGNTKVPDDTLVTYGYLEAFKEQLRAEIIAELTAEGGVTITSAYNDVSVKEGQMLLLSPNSEIIYRGGGAVAITSSDKKGEGITDMSGGTELYSGEPLEYGHIYYASESESKKAILITGATAYFTVRGDYEIE